MPLDKPALAAALKTAFEQGMADADWTLDQAAGAMADAIDAYVRTADVINVAVDVVDAGSNPIGTGTQSTPGGLA